MLLLVRALLRGETLQHESAWVTAKDLQLTWTPQRADIPIYIAARGARMLEAAGELADGGAIGALVSEEGLDYAFGALERGAARAGRSLGDFEIVSWVTCRVVDDESAAHERLKPSVAHIIGGAPLSLLRAIGMESGYIADLKRAYAAGGPAGAAPLVTRREIDMLTIVGSAARVRETWPAPGATRRRANRHPAHRRRRRQQLPGAGAHRPRRDAALPLTPRKSAGAGP